MTNRTGKKKDYMKKSMKIKPIDTTYQSVKHILEEARKKAYSIVNFAFPLRSAAGEPGVRNRCPSGALLNSRNGAGVLEHRNDYC